MVLSSAVVCDHDRRIAEGCFHMIADDRRPHCDLRSAIIWRPAFMFYLLRSSAIMVAGSQTIAEVCFHMIADDRRPYCDLRSAIRDHMETSLYIEHGSTFCDRLRSRSQDRRSSFHMIADDRRPYCDLRSAIIWKPAFNVKCR